MKKYLSANNIVLAVLFLLGGYWTLTAFSLELWIRNGPGPGFFPLVAGVFCLLFSGFLLIKSLNKDEGTQFRLRALLPLGGLLAVLLSSYVIGVFLALVLFVFLWIYVYEKHPLKNAVTIAIIWPGILYLVFVVWLGSPLPKGIIGLL